MESLIVLSDSLQQHLWWPVDLWLAVISHVASLGMCKGLHSRQWFHLMSEATFVVVVTPRSESMQSMTLPVSWLLIWVFAKMLLVFLWYRADVVSCYSGYMDGYTPRLKSTIELQTSARLSLFNTMSMTTIGFIYFFFIFPHINYMCKYADEVLFRRTRKNRVLSIS